MTQSVSLFLEKAEDSVWNHSESPLLASAECAVGEEIAGQKCCAYHQLNVTHGLLHTSPEVYWFEKRVGININKLLSQMSICQGISI